MIRAQLPSYSPLRLGGLLTGASRGALGGSGALDALRTRLRERLDAHEVVLTGSGTQALQLALVTIAGPGATVALPAYSCYDLVSAAVGAGVRVRFYDIDPATLTPDLDSLQRVLSGGPRALVVGNLYGLPLPWRAIREAAEAAGVLVVEDAAQGLDSRFDGREGGSFGDLTVLSFGRGKGWTGGGGGALLRRGAPEITAPEAPGGGTTMFLKASLQWAAGRPWLYGLPRAVPGLRLGETVYHPPLPPRALPPIAAATLLAHEADARAELSHRSRHGEHWRSLVAVSGPGVSTVGLIEGGLPAYHRFPLLADTSERREVLCSRGADYGVAPAYPRTLPTLEAVRPLTDDEPGGFPGAATLAARLLTLPTHSRVGRRDILAIEKLLSSTG